MSKVKGNQTQNDVNALEQSVSNDPTIQSSLPPHASPTSEQRPPQSHPLFPNSISFGWLETPSVVSLLIFASIWGVLLRLGLTALATYDGLTVFPLLWPQTVGCFIMGFIVGIKDDVENLYAPLYVAIGTGLCGSTTTFSTWMFDVFTAFGNINGSNHHGLHNVIDAFSQAVTTLGMAIAAILFGTQCSKALKDFTLSRLHRLPSAVGKSDPPEEKKESKEGPASAFVSQGFHHVLPALIGPAFWIGAAFLCAFKPSWRDPVTFSLVFGPPGTLFRWYLGKSLNPKVKGFPLGTFTANILATLLEAVFMLLSNSGIRNQVGLEVLGGMENGFCGCLSTVSTFALEVVGMDRTWWKWRYVLVSWAVAQALLVVVFGSYWWSRGLVE